ncbi:hypothetical protein OBK30_00490 [Empedobacter falsenii]
MENEIKEILKSIINTAKPIDKHVNYPTNPGIYVFMLNNNADLGLFGVTKDVIYVGIAKESLKKRDLNNHFNSNSTGSSTLRRSIGAILKNELQLTAYSRNGTDKKIEITNYIFNKEGEERLTNWMKTNLTIGYWEDHNKIPYDKLRKLEEDIIINLRPSLDIDNRTKKFNKLVHKLTELREICKNEAKHNTP